MLAGSLKDAGNGIAVSNASLWVSLRRGAYAMTLPDEKGLFAFRNLPASVMELWVEAQGYPFEPKRKVRTRRRGPQKDLVLTLGEEGGSLRLSLEGSCDFLDADSSEFEVFMGMGVFNLQRFARQQEDWTFLTRGLPPGDQSIRVSCTQNGIHYSGAASVELEENKITHARIVLR
jgi:hypothetical protein